MNITREHSNMNKMATLERFDDFFFGILQNCEQIEPFLEVVFSFLARRTDFFRVMHNKTDKMGLPPGVAEKMLLKIFKKYQSIVLQSTTPDEEVKSTKKKNSSSKLPQSSTVSVPDNQPPPAISTIDVQTSSDDDKTQQTSTPESIKETTTSQLHEPSKAAECFNGAMLENYMWSQTGSDVDVRLPVESTVKGKDILVEIKEQYLKVALKNTPEPKVLLDGELQWKVHADESMWTLIPGEHIHISLDKVEDRWWTCVLRGDKEIDKNKIDTTRDISEFDEQTQSDYHRALFEHQQKMLRKPTSQEMKTHEMLKKAWDAPNSPFAGTPFDPSAVNISGEFS